MRIGIDIGGTKIEILVLDENGKEVIRKRVVTPAESYQAILNVITSLVLESEQIVNHKCSIGICSPGSISPALGVLRNSNTLTLNNKPFKKDLEQSLGREVRLANDANCFALSEAIDGAGQDAASVFGVIVGTGTGGGLVVNKHILPGVNAIAGEWGHNPLPWSENEELTLTKCWCGKHGCIETFLSGPGLENDFERVTGTSLDVQKIVAQSENGNTIAENVLCRYENRMARGLAHLINIVDPTIIVLGGGMSNIERLYENVPKLWQQWIFSDCVFTKLLPPKHGDSGGVRGAAWLWGKTVSQTNG